MAHMAYGGTNRWTDTKIIAIPHEKFVWIMAEQQSEFSYNNLIFLKALEGNNASKKTYMQSSL